MNETKSIRWTETVSRVNTFNDVSPSVYRAKTELILLPGKKHFNIVYNCSDEPFKVKQRIPLSKQTEKILFELKDVNIASTVQFLSI